VRRARACRARWPGIASQQRTQHATHAPHHTLVSKCCTRRCFCRPHTGSLATSAAGGCTPQTHTRARVSLPRAETPPWPEAPQRGWIAPAAAAACAAAPPHAALTPPDQRASARGATLRTHARTLPSCCAVDDKQTNKQTSKQANTHTQINRHTHNASPLPPADRPAAGARPSEPPAPASHPPQRATRPSEPPAPASHPPQRATRPSEPPAHTRRAAAAPA
jgi:hypothetical protein